MNGVAVNATGDIFLAKSQINVLRKVDHASGKIHTVAGQIGVACADTTCGGEGVAATQATLNTPDAVTVDGSGDPIITDQGDNAIRGVLADGTIRTLAGALSQTPGLGPITGPAGSAQFSSPVNAALDGSGNLFIADAKNTVIWKVNAPTALKAQNITFSPIPAATYGDPSIDLTHYAITDSGLALSFTCVPSTYCSGTNNATLSVIGAGTVTVTASQGGDSAFAPATPKSVTVQINKASLSVKADDISFAYRGAPQLPPLTYSFRGFVDGDTKSVVAGSPVLSTTATPTSPLGQYPITLGLGTLSAANYSFTPANGTLTITGGAAQTITFNPLPNVTYGVATFDLGATASSGGVVTYTVSGPAQALGSKITVTGVGTVSVTANQAGNPSTVLHLQ